MEDRKERNTRCQKLVNTLLKNCNQQESFIDDWVVIKSVVTPKVCYTIYQHINMTTFVLHMNVDISLKYNRKNIVSGISSMPGDWVQDKENPYMWFLEKMNTEHESKGTHIYLGSVPPKTIPSLDKLKDRQNRELNKLETTLIWDTPSSKYRKSDTDPEKIVMIGMNGCGACESMKKNIATYERETGKDSNIEIVDCAVSEDGRCKKVEGFPTFFKGDSEVSCRIGSGSVNQVNTDCS